LEINILKTEYDKELEKKLSDLIRTEKVKILNNEFFFELLEKNYPIGLNRIGWEKVDKKILKILDNDSLNNENVIKKEIEKFFKQIISSYPKIVDEMVVAFGDEAINQAYQMSFDLFQKFSWDFFSLPQHTYVLTQTIIKCINFTFEGELYFG
jgi:hypothetical protein